MEMDGNEVEESPMGDQIVTGGDIHADQVTAQGMINQINANHVDLENSAVLMVQSGSMDITNGGIGFARTEQAVFTTGGVGILVANSVNGEDLGANFLISREVQATAIKTTVLLAGRVDGPVETKVDARGAMFAGLAAGIGLGAVLVITRLLGDMRRE